MSSGNCHHTQAHACTFTYVQNSRFTQPMLAPLSCASTCSTSQAHLVHIGPTSALKIAPHTANQQHTRPSSRSQFKICMPSALTHTARLMPAAGGRMEDPKPGCGADGAARAAPVAALLEVAPVGTDTSSKPALGATSTTGCPYGSTGPSRFASSGGNLAVSTTNRHDPFSSTPGNAMVTGSS